MKWRWETVSAAVALGMGIVLATPEAYAQASGGELARMRYRQGSEAYRAGRYRESVDYFLEADSLAPSAALSFNIARAYEKMDDPSASLRWYRDYLRRSPDAKDKADVETLAHGFEQRLAQKGVQQITVMSDPAGAAVLVDDRAVGVTPYTTDLPVGPHRLELRKDGFVPNQGQLNIADHAADVSITLAAAPVAAPSAAPAAPPPSANGSGSPAADAHSIHSNGFPTRTLGWVLVGVGGAALGTGLVFEISRHQAETDAKHETTQLGYKDKLDSMESRQTTARIFAIAGGVLAIAGGTLVILGGKKEGQPAVTAACAPGGCWSTVRGSF